MEIYRYVVLELSPLRACRVTISSIHLEIILFRHRGFRANHLGWWTNR